ncbi:MAG: YCF48-related protein [Gallionella sp.]|nr:YCF48-related protein [Gallionella sp.]MDD4960018.1 YCF48-related protein [Gallionella sp.]
MDNQHRQSNALLAWSWLKTSLFVWILSTSIYLWQISRPFPPLETSHQWSLWKSVEINPQRQLFSFNNYLKAITFSDDNQHGWAVGYKGTILSTTNSGHNWHRETTNTSESLRALYFHTDAQHGWAVGQGGAIIATVDGGKTWNSQISNTNIWLFSIKFHIDALQGWAVGYNGTILATTDGGRNWTFQDSGTKNLLRSVSFLPDGQHGWAVGDNGTIISTNNAGKTWFTQNSNSSKWLYSICILADGLHGWTIGDEGTIVATIDGGSTWYPQRSNTTQKLNSVHFDSNGQLGWAVGNEGVIISTNDGGKNWYAQVSNTELGLNDIHFSNDKKHGWVVGDGNVILITADGGNHWQYAESYSRIPAPWYWITVLLSAWLLWQAWRRSPEQKFRDSIADMAASDAEIRLASEDRLEFIGLARGISRFLRNAETRPPLTLAITGDWGSGKSSLMQLVCADLRASGHRPIWFNAWHHQKEEHLFAALLGAVYAQAVPSLWSWQGVNFRLRLLWLRSKQHFGVLMLVVMAVTIALVVSLPALQQGKFKDISDNFASLQQWGAPVLAGLTALFALWKGMRPFGVNPALLLTRLRDNMSLRAASAQNDFRAQFARQFGELVQALPYRLVLVIDDLDRCRPTAVLDVMETVNYLTSAGECFVIFGMASERMQAALGLAFKDIAAELVQMEGGVHLSEANADTALMKRRGYAADYLQKLVNIEIKVPDTHDQPVHQLLATPEAAPRQRVLSVYQDLKKLSPLFAVGIAIAAGLWVANWWQPQAQAPAPVMAVQPVMAQSAVLPAPAPVSLPEVIEPQRKERPASAATVQAGETTSVGTMLAWLGAAMLPLLAVGVLVLVKLLRRSRLVTRDSQNFRDALAIWTGVVAAKRSTPRAIKRFGNRLRYLAMLQQGELKDETLAESLRAWLRSKLQRTAATAPPPPVDTLAEHQLIAMGAFYEVMGAEWKVLINQALETNWETFLEERKDHLEYALRTAIAAHQTKFNCPWPPSPAEIAVFEKLLSGVRLAGDPQPIKVAPEENNSMSGAMPAESVEQ